MKFPALDVFPVKPKVPNNPFITSEEISWKKLLEWRWKRKFTPILPVPKSQNIVSIPCHSWVNCNGVRYTVYSIDLVCVWSKSYQSGRFTSLRPKTSMSAWSVINYVNNKPLFIRTPKIVHIPLLFCVLTSGRVCHNMLRKIITHVQIL